MGKEKLEKSLRKGRRKTENEKRVREKDGK